MSDESYSFSTARARLEDIVSQVRKKDTSLEKSLDLLEEGVRLANSCTELIDHADWSAGDAGAEAAADAVVVGPEAGEPETGEPEAEGDDAGVVAEVVAGADASVDQTGEEETSAGSDIEA